MLVDPIVNLLQGFKSRQFRRAIILRIGLISLVVLVGAYLVWDIARPAIDGTPCPPGLQLELHVLANKGYKILFKSSNKATDKPNSYIMNADGTSVQPFIDSDQYKRFGPQKREHPFPEAETVWSPDGTRSIKNTYQLGNIDPVFQSPLGEATGNVNWSPDGRYIVFPVYDRKFTGDQGGGKLTSQIYVAATQYLGACPLDVPVELLYQLPEWVLEIRP